MADAWTKVQVPSKRLACEALHPSDVVVCPEVWLNLWMIRWISVDGSKFHQFFIHGIISLWIIHNEMALNMNPVESRVGHQSAPIAHHHDPNNQLNLIRKLRIGKPILQQAVNNYLMILQRKTFFWKQAWGIRSLNKSWPTFPKETSQPSLDKKCQPMLEKTKINAEMPSEIPKPIREEFRNLCFSKPKNRISNRPIIFKCRLIILSDHGACEGGRVQGRESVCWTGPWFLGFKVSSFLGFKVSWFRSCKVSWFRSFKMSWFSWFQRFTKCPFDAFWKILIPYSWFPRNY